MLTNEKDFLTLSTIPTQAILSLVHRALVFKHANKLPPKALAQKSIALLFTKPSTRTRISAESACAAMGGHPMFLGQNDIHCRKGGEVWRDTAVVVGSMVDAIFARLGDHSEIVELAKYSRVPVINALTAKFHPMQALADIMTIYETLLAPEVIQGLVGECDEVDKIRFPILGGVNVAWVGDANNIINSLLVSLPRLGINVTVATPVGYVIDEDIKEYVENAEVLQIGSGIPYGKVVYTNSPMEAVKNANFIITDTWVSMGQEAEKVQRLKDFEGFQVTEKMAADGGAKKNWKFMHCLPRKPEEVDDEVFYNQGRSLVFPEAENRKWTAMAVFEGIGQKSNSLFY